MGFVHDGTFTRHCYLTWAFPSIWLHDECDSRKFVSWLNYTKNISFKTLHETERCHTRSGSERFAAIVIHLTERNTAFCDNFDKLHHKRNGIFQGQIELIAKFDPAINEHKGKAKLSPPLTNEALRHEHVWGSGFIDPHFPDLDTSSEWSASRPCSFNPGNEGTCKKFHQ
jgi:hypothetical protein